jgi:hypothetical protein
MMESETGALVYIETRQPVPPGQAQMCIVKEGSWKRMDALDPAALPEEGAYSWSEPLRSRTRSVTVDDLYSPFVSGGIILCAHDPKAQGSAQFALVHLVPRGWERYVKDAWEEFRNEPALRRAMLNDEDYARLKVPAAGPNPVVAVISLRRLVDSGKLPSNWPPTAADDGRVAELTYLLLRSGERPADRLRALLDKGGSDAARPIAAGVLAAALMGADSAMQENAKALLKELFPETVADPYVRKTLEILGA